MRWDIGIDLGTESVRMADGKQGPFKESAAALAFREGRDTPVYGGDAAEKLEGRVCEGIEIQRPLKDGVLENNFTADRMFHWIYRQADVLSRRRRFSMLLTCAPFARPVLRDAMISAAIDAGADCVALVRGDSAAAIGAGLDLDAPEAKLVVDIGAGKISATLFTLGRIASYGYLPYGMNRIDERVQRGIRLNYGYRIGRSSAREIKHTLGTALPNAAASDVLMHMTGFSISERVPKVFDVETQPVLEACEDVVREIIGLVASVVDNAPEELSADLTDAGAVLTGAGAELTGLNKRLGDALGIPCRVADAPGTCAIRGVYQMMLNPEKYSQAILDQRMSANWR